MTRTEQITEIKNQIGRAVALSKHTVDIEALLAATENEAVRAYIVASDTETQQNKRDQLQKLRQSIWYQIGKLAADTKANDFIAVATETIELLGAI